MSIGAHRLMLRPREGRDLRLMSHTLAITPASVLTWAHDVFGNAVAMATFAATTDMLVIDSAADILLGSAHTLVSSRMAREDDCGNSGGARACAIDRADFSAEARI